ncbi:MAG: D-alanyl-D-alanine carboxypeptidase family protein, partial [Pseudomonadota bacterium]
MRTGRRRPRGAVILFRTLIAVLIAVLFSSATVSGADARAKSAALVIDANTGRVLHEQNADAIRYPASLTKMMTLFMVFEAIEQKRMSYKTIIRATKAATRKPPSKIGLKVGDKLTVRQAVAALVTKSANDVAAAVAIHLAGSEAAFARQMTRRARQIGMRNTRFRNASGLTDRLQRTTARDMIVLALRLQDDYPTHFRNFRLRSFTWRGRRFGNHNTLLRSFYGTTGIKTGYTRASGFNLVSSVKRGRKHVVAAVFGGRTSRARNAKMRILLARALKRASTRKTRKGRPLLVAQPRPVARPASLSLASIRPKPKSVRRQARQQTRRPAARPVTRPVPRQLARKTTRAPAAPARARTARPADARAVARTPQIAVARTRRVLFRDPTTRARQPQPRAVPSSRAGIRAGMAPTSITDLIRQAAAPIRSPSSAGA